MIKESSNAKVCIADINNSFNLIFKLQVLLEKKQSN